MKQTLVALAFQAVTVGALIAVGMMLELAWRTRASRLASSAVFNIGYTAFVLVFQGTIGATLAAAVAGAMQSLPGHGLIRLPAAAHASWAAIALTALVWIAVGDFFYYWFHRWQHTSRWLWAQHELHHADEAMNVTTTWRHHWTEQPLNVIVLVAPLSYLIAAPISVLAVAGALSQAMAHFIHLDVRFSLGRWNWLLANPHTHRIHHSMAEPHLDKNFAAALPIWDVLFGTFYHPKKGEHPRTGIASMPGRLTFYDALVMPFRKWAAMIAERRARGAALKLNADT